MKIIIGAALVAAQVLAGPAAAADLPRDEGSAGHQRSAFAGARLRVPIGGHEAGRARASLALTSIDRSRLGAGGERLRFGEGLELALSARKKPRLTLGGKPVSELGAGPSARGGKAGISTLGWAAIGVIGTLVLVEVALWRVAENADCRGGINDPDCS